MDEFQLQAERAAQRRVDDLQTELADLKAQAAKRDAELRARDAELDSVSVFVTEKVTIDRRLQLAEARVKELEQQLAHERERHLAESAERRAALEARHSKELEETERDAIERTNAAISAETRVLRQQNADLQRALLLLRNQQSGSRMGEFGFPSLSLSQVRSQARQGTRGRGETGGAPAPAGGDNPLQLSAATMSEQRTGRGTAEKSAPSAPSAPSAASQSTAATIPTLPTLGRTSGQGASSASAQTLRAARMLEEDPALSHLSLADVEKYAGEVDSALQQDVGKAYLTIKRLKAEITSLKMAHEQEKKEASDFIAGVLLRVKNERRDMTYELKALEKLVYSKCKELYKIRSLAQAILQQRTNLEAVLTRAMVTDLGLEQGPAPYPQTMAEMERQLNEPIHVGVQKTVSGLTAEEVANLARRWAAEIEKAGA